MISATELAAIKTSHLDALADHTRTLYQAPQLRKLFFELTLQCNECCFHCGSSCTAVRTDELTCDEWLRIIDEVKADFGTSGIQLCITGGEPLLNHDFFAIMSHAHEQGFSWGMTSNATLITPQVARQLADVGMGTISVSIDGLRDTHDKLRGLKGGYDRAMAGIQNLIDVGTFSAVQVTTVVNHANIDQLDELFRIMDGLDIDSWRVINLEPIGRALLRPDLMLTPEDYRRLFEFIRQKRRQGYPLEYGCSHYLGLEYEAEVREWYWLCNAGVYTASIMANGDIGACLDIERRPETIQGNIRHDRLLDVWQNRFELFRRDLSDSCASCRSCDHVRFCRGDAHHSWDYDNNRPLVCLKDILF
jgi:radical SAM protein with 4Fe4S-binding SPASM domain